MFTHHNTYYIYRSVRSRGTRMFAPVVRGPRVLLLGTGRRESAPAARRRARTHFISGSYILTGDTGRSRPLRRTTPYAHAAPMTSTIHYDYVTAKYCQLSRQCTNYDPGIGDQGDRRSAIAGGGHPRRARVRMTRRLLLLSRLMYPQTARPLPRRRARPNSRTRCDDND